MIKSFLFSSILICSPWVLAAQLTIVLDQIPANTPANAPIHIAGNFQGWLADSPDYQLLFDAEQEWHHITLDLEIGDHQFKFTRGEWTKVEGDANGNVVPNRDYSYSGPDTIYLQVLGWEDLSGGNSSNSTAAENVSILSEDFYMSELDRYRRIWLYLPPDYESSDRDYPVIYMHDGQNVFDAETSFVGEWEVDETLNELHANGDPGAIVVAIDNGGALRTAEYTPWSHPTYGGGQGAAYINFIVNELKPYIDDNYRTLSDRNSTAIMGSSLGGLISTYAGIEHQEIFSKVGAFSPAYWINNPQTFQHVTDTAKEHPMRFYQLAGTLEGEVYIEQMFEMQDELFQAGFNQEEVFSQEHTDGEHSEWYWAREFAEVYLWLFRTEPNSIEESTDLFQALLSPNPVKDQFQLSFRLPEAGLLRVEIVDSVGRSNGLIYSNELAAGSHDLAINPQRTNLPAGSYFCRISLGNQHQLLPFVKVD
ncbi:MAG: alpha/beta hydrolase-fold protein [Bacteroidota bacterium]